MIYENEPYGFKSVFEVVSCFVEHNGKILMLHRQDSKPQGNSWAGPAGKVDSGEDLVKALLREVYEETGLNLREPKYFKKLYVRFPEYDFVYHIFHEILEDFFDVQIREKEHKDFKWVEPKSALDLPLMLDEDLCIKMFYNI